MEKLEVENVFLEIMDIRRVSNVHAVYHQNEISSTQFFSGLYNLYSILMHSL